MTVRWKVEIAEVRTYAVAPPAAAKAGAAAQAWGGGAIQSR